MSPTQAYNAFKQSLPKGCLVQVHDIFFEKTITVAWVHKGRVLKIIRVFPAFDLFDMKEPEAFFKPFLEEIQKAYDLNPSDASKDVHG